MEATWANFSLKHGLDLTHVLSSQSTMSLQGVRMHRAHMAATHGIRTIDNLRRLSGITDEDELKVRDVRSLLLDAR